MKKNFCFSIIFFVGLLIGSACTDQKTENQTQTEEQETAETEVGAEEEVASPLTRKSGEVNGVKVNMQYGSPGVKSRNVWGELVKYGEVWRTGANEATWVEFDQDVMVNGQPLPKGKYALFTTIHENNEWTVIFNKEWDQWGAFDYDDKKDALRIPVTPETSEDKQERMNFMIEDDAIVFSWEYVRFRINVEKA